VYDDEFDLKLPFARPFQTPCDIESLDIFRSCTPDFFSIRVKSWHHILASAVIWGSKKAIYVFSVTKSTWNCLLPGRFRPHVWVSHLTCVGCIPHLRFLLDPSEILAPHTCERNELMFKQAFCVCVITNSTWNCRSPGRFKPHVTSSHLTYSGRVPPIPPRSEWNRPGGTPCFFNLRVFIKE